MTPYLARLTGLLLAVVLLAGWPAVLRAFDTSARAAFVLDQKTGTVLLDKNADTPLPPASMSKLMTLYMAFEAIRDGRLTLDERLPVSDHAMSFGGSTMFLNTRDRVRVEDLLKGIIVLSGNDASVVIAEALSPDGTEAGFARLMTARARQMGMTNSSFANASGWPAPDQRMSMRDLGILADRLITDFPEYYPWFAMEEYEFGGRAPANKFNRNPLLGLGIGADGLKTGRTREAGFGLVGSGIRGDRRVIFVISGLDSEAARAEEAEAILNWSFRGFAERTYAQAGDTVAQAQVWLGRRGTVDLNLAEDITLLMPVPVPEALEAEVVYTGPVEAPVAEGQELGALLVKRGDQPDLRIPLLAGSTVEETGFRDRLWLAVDKLLGRDPRPAEGT